VDNDGGDDMSSYVESSKRSGHLLTKDHYENLIKDRIAKLFRCLKFITDTRHLRWNSAFATKIVHPELGLDSWSNAELDDWWFKFGGTMKKIMESKRNGVVNGIKNTFMSEYACMFGNVLPQAIRWGMSTGGLTSFIICFTVSALVCLFAELRNFGALPASMEPFLELRKNEDVMKVFADHIVPCIIGRSVFKQNKVKQVFTQLASISDEAFGLLVLEHIWDVWIDKDLEAYKDKMAKGMGGGAGVEKRKREPPLAGKYTDSHTKRGRSHGWTAAGLTRFNELMSLVKEDRKSDNGKFDQTYLQYKQDEEKANKEGKKTRNPPVMKTIVECECDFS